MIITITSSLTDEQALILAKEKGYSETITILENPGERPEIFTNIPNPQTYGEFLKNIYEAMIIQDATKNYIAIYDRNRKAEQETELNAIKEQVIGSITSSVI